MVSIVCNSGISFFNHYIKTFYEFENIKIETYYLNSNLNINNNLDFELTNNSLKSFQLKDLFNFYKYFKFYKKVKKSKSSNFHFISVHPLNLMQIIILKLFRKNIISTIHDLKPHPDWKSIIINNVQKIIIKLSNTIILHNHSDSNKIQNSKFIPLSGYDLNIQKKILIKLYYFLAELNHTKV